jgi:hypothetical protein
MKNLVLIKDIVKTIASIFIAIYTIILIKEYVISHKKISNKELFEYVILVFLHNI